METFRLIAVTLSLILGLGVTRVLSGTIAVFRSRKHAKLDWIPLVWAAAIFVLQIQYWWAIIELPSMTASWTLADFLILLSIPLVLFVAAALILPLTELDPDTSLSDMFERDGRWGLLCLSAYASFAILLDWMLFNVDLVSPATAMLALEFILPVLFLFASSRRVKEITTVLYLALVLWSSWELSPKIY